MTAADSITPPTRCPKVRGFASLMQLDRFDLTFRPRKELGISVRLPHPRNRDLLNRHALPMAHPDLDPSEGESVLDEAFDAQIPPVAGDAITEKDFA